MKLRWFDVVFFAVMWALLIANIAYLLLGCGDNIARPDAPISNGPITNWETPFDEACAPSDSPFCAHGRGLCIIGRCVEQCSGVYPHCPDDKIETWRMDGPNRQCFCVSRNVR